MFLSKTMRELIVADLRQNPLAGDELRRVDGMGELYFANADDETHPNFLYQFTLVVDGTSYLFFHKLMFEVE
jgi:hypothetical protein